MNQSFDFLWLNNPGYTKEIVNLFTDNLEPEYISHTEILIGRSVNETEWDADLPKILKEEITSILNGNDSGLRAAAVMLSKSIVGVCLIQEIKTRKNKIWVIEDIILSKHLRDHGAGTEFLKWIESEATRHRANYLFCESGIQNEGAHHFFIKNGFKPLSQTFIKKISRSA